MNSRLEDRRAPTGWPDRNRTLLLQAALWPDQRGLEALRGYSHAVGDILEVDDETSTLVPLLSRNLLEMGVDQPELPLLKGAYRKAWCRNVITARGAVGALDDLAAVRIPTLILGGPALAQLHYREIAARPFTCLDVLVPLGDAQRAREALAARGWRGEFATGAVPNGAHRGERLERADGEAFGLRWRALAEPMDEMPLWEAAIAFELLGRPTLTLAPTDHLLYVCVEGLRWGPAPPIQWAADAATLVGTGRIDWERLVALAVAGGVTPPVRDALAYLDDALGLAIPGEALRALRVAPTPIRNRRAYRAGLGAPRPLRTLAVHWDRHRRLRELAGHPGFPSFAHYLAALWRLPSPWHLPAEALRWVGRGPAAR